jgi:hypothetical protein
MCQLELLEGFQKAGPIGFIGRGYDKKHNFSVSSSATDNLAKSRGFAINIAYTKSHGASP